MSRVLAIPLAVRLAVPPPAEALLSNEGADVFANALAEALQAVDVPAVATTTPQPLDWRLQITASNTGSTVQPRFEILNADGRSQTAFQGTAIPTAAWAEGSPELLRSVAAQAAPRVTQALLSVQAARASATPAALQAGPSRVRLMPVRGAPGDGNLALGNRMREFLGTKGYVVQDIAEGAAYGVTAEVAVVPGSPGTNRVEIQWIVSRRDGHELGRVVQINEVPLGSLNRFWGDVAYVAAQEAAGGVETIINNANTLPPAGSG